MLKSRGEFNTLLLLVKSIDWALVLSAVCGKTATSQVLPTTVVKMDFQGDFMVACKHRLDPAGTLYRGLPQHPLEMQ
ncbi:hypothetical protein IWZ03DRAFT_160154 [Phyllosticta citriasiana]|uniref:Uncharacterized protein n=1 Tax=Phyllosticta citriasiana TaxID=595635 RepID=A0ABR1KUG8_9PEZI